MKQISKENAEALWAQLADGFGTIERVLPEIIKARAWEPLEYEKNTKGHDNRCGPQCTQERQYQMTETKRQPPKEEGRLK